MRRTLVPAVLAGALLLAPHASAAPTAGPEDAAIAAFTVTTTSGATFYVQLAGSAPGSGSPRLRALIGPAGGALRDYGATLPAGAFRTDGSQATLRTSLAGQPLSIRWTVTDAVVAFTGDETDGAGWHAAGRGGRAVIRLGTRSCRSDDGLIGTLVGHDSGSYGAPVGSWRIGQVARCDAVVSQPLL